MADEPLTECPHEKRGPKQHWVLDPATIPVMDSDATERAIEALRMTALPAEAMAVDQVTVLTVDLRLVLNELDRLRAEDA